MLRNGETNSPRQLIGITLNEILEGLFRIKLRIQSLGNGCIKRSRRLVATTDSLRGLNLSRHLTFHLLYRILIIITHYGNNTVAENDIFTKHACEYLS